MNVLAFSAGFVLALATGPAALALPATEAGEVGAGAQTLRYDFYAPARTGPLPLVLALHGCWEQPRDFEAGTAWFEDARQAGYAVAMPAHPVAPGRDADGCWRWEDQFRRADTEMRLLREIVTDVARRVPVDRDRVYVAGMSSGGYAALSLALDYPEVFAAVGVASAGERGPCGNGSVDTCDAGILDAARNLEPRAAAAAALADVPAAEGALPAIFIHGDDDELVPEFNLWLGLQTVAIRNDGALGGGAYRGCFRLWATAYQTYPGDGNRHPYDVYDAMAGDERWVVVHGMKHRWSGGAVSPASNASNGRNFNDPAGPAATRLMREFFTAHPRSTRRHAVRDYPANAIGYPCPQ